MIEKKGNEYYLGDRKLGEVHGDRFVTHRDPEHFYKKGPGLCINKELIEKLKSKQVVIIYRGKEGEKVFKGKAEDMLLFPTVHEEGWDKQLLVKEKKFRGG